MIASSIDAPVVLVSAGTDSHWRFKMPEFRVSFYKTLQNASGHSSKHLQKQFDLTSDTPSGALVAAERLFGQRV